MIAPALLVMFSALPRDEKAAWPLTTLGPVGLACAASAKMLTATATSSRPERRACIPQNPLCVIRPIINREFRTLAASE
jgi:hypothetical protein